MRTRLSVGADYVTYDVTARGRRGRNSCRALADRPTQTAVTRTSQSSVRRHAAISRGTSDTIPQMRYVPCSASQVGSPDLIFIVSETAYVESSKVTSITRLRFLSICLFVVCYVVFFLPKRINVYI